MATIQQSIAISDGLTGPLKKMEQGAVAAANRFDQAANAAQRVENTVSEINSRGVNSVGMAASTTAGQLNVASAAAVQTATSVGAIGGAALTARAGIVGLGIAITTAFGAITAIIGLVLGAFHTISGGIHLSDEYSSILARMKLITSSQQEAVDLNDQIYYSALRARGSYAGMADSVSKIGLTAKEAFPDPKQIVPFVEGIQKLFTVGGTGIQQQADAMLQLTQALGSGKLQGDEFRSIAEAAPLIEQMVAKHMKVTQGELKELSSKGEITANIIKNAILENLDEIDEKFATMPMTWGQIWQNIETQSFRAFVPVFDQLSALANSPAIQSFSSAILVAITIAGAGIAGLINNFRWLSAEVCSVGSIIGNVFEYIAGFAISALFVYALGLATVNAQVAISAIYHGMMTAALIAQNIELGIAYARIGLITAAKAVWTLVTGGLIAALSFLNLVLFANPIPLVILAVGLIITAFGAWAIASHGLRNTIADVFEGIVDICETGVNIMIKSINGLIGVINKASEGLNGLFGTSIGTVDLVEEVSFKGFRKYGDSIRNGTLLADLFEIPSLPDVNSMQATMPKLDDIANASKDTAGNTKGIKEALEITDEDIKYLRDIAEQEVVNKYTTAEVKIEMGGVHNNVSSDTDLDGMMRYINDNLFDAMCAGAKKVHV